MLEIDRFRKVRRQGEETVVGDVVHPLDDFRDARRRARRLRPPCGTELTAACFSAPEKRFVTVTVCGSTGRLATREPIVEERIALDVEMQRRIVLHGVADLDQPVGQPVTQAVAIEHRHHDVDVGLELDQPLARYR